MWEGTREERHVISCRLGLCEACTVGHSRVLATRRKGRHRTRRGRTGRGGREEGAHRTRREGGAHRKRGLGPAAVRRVATAALPARDPQLAPPAPSPPPLPPGCCVNTSPSSLPFHKHIPGPWDPLHTLHWAAAVTCRYNCNGHHGANWTGKYGQCHAIQRRKTTKR